ncbi:MAG: rhomboid family intramembrane serine protease [Bdellovibrionales bacterium]|nr:rhomboid family intramembrane serine protease [Bdellovibrionales bacterium]
MDSSENYELHDFNFRLRKTLLSEAPKPASFWVTGLMVLLMALMSQIYWHDTFGISDFLPAIREKVFQQGQWWRVFTATFIHADLEHFLSNLLMLTVFSYFVFGYFGSLVLPVVLLVLAGLVNAMAIFTYPAEVQLVGASGLVYLLGGFWLTMYLILQRQYKWLNRSLRVLGTGMVLFLPTSFVPTTSYRTHGIGFAIGVIAALVYFILNHQKLLDHEIYEPVFEELELVERG